MMELLPFIVFTGGFFTGIVIALILGVKIDTRRHNLLPPDLDPAVCVSGGGVQVGGNIPLQQDGMTLESIHTHAYDVLVGNPPEVPPSGAGKHGTSLPVTVNPPTPQGTIVVWAHYCTHISASVAYNCGSSSGGPSGGSSDGMKRMLPIVASGAVDAVPKSFLIAPAPGTPGASTGPGAELVGALQSPESVLRYVAEASTPAEPLWRALGGPRAPFEATLVLLHRTGGVGAVLTIVTEVGGRRVQFTWVTSNWAFNGANHLRCESDEPGLPALVVAPA